MSNHRSGKNRKYRRRRPKQEPAPDDHRYMHLVAAEHGCCAACGKTHRRQQPIVQRWTPREALCLTCADSKGIDYDVSKRVKRGSKHRDPIPSNIIGQRDPANGKTVPQLDRERARRRRRTSKPRAPTRKTP